jgi:O-antigen/teichoic acid export membrane protein
MGFWARFQALLIKLLPRNSFVRSVGVLAGGTAFAQLIGVIALPFITRMYTPEDFSVLAVFSSMLGIVTGIACLRLDIAIPIPEKEDEAANLLGLAMLTSTAIAMLTALIIWWFSDNLVNTAGQTGLGLQPFLWMLPPCIWLAGSYSAIQFWATRRKRFNAIARTRISQTIGSTVTQLLYGLSGLLGPFGLLLGLLIANGFGVIGLCRLAWREDRKVLRAINFADMVRQVRANDRFIKYSTFEAIANNGAIQIPIVIIGAVALGPDAGYLLLAMRMMTIPISLIGGAVSQVYLSHAPEEYRAGQIGHFTLKTIEGLVRTGIGPLIFVGIISPAAFPIIFGSEWERAGEMVAWMTPLCILQLISSPVSMAFHITSHQHTALNLQIYGFILRVGGVWLAFLFANNYIFEVYVLTGVVFYFTYLIVIAKITKIQSYELAQIMLANFMLILTWIFIGAIFIYSASHTIINIK